MQIHGFNKTTLLDYPGLVACTVFTGACNFRCPFCQNSDLVLNPSSQPEVCEEEIISHLVKRKNIVEGVCITGGEPTLQPDLKEFICKLRELKVKIKLDTNGYNPDILKELIVEGLVDYVAMDVKSSFSSYSKAAGIDVDVSKVKESIELLINSDITYEFRTTVTKELHDEEVFREIAGMLKGAKQYFLQQYVDSERVLKPGMSAYSPKELSSFLPIFEGFIGVTRIRGVDL